MTTTLYRIYDHTDQEILAHGISSLAEAEKTLELLKLDLPTHDLEIESFLSRYES